MKYINKIKAAAVATLFSMSFSSCSDWLEVKMEDKIMESVLYSNYYGYVSAINGIYIGMNSYYTPDFTMGVIDVMAQYYNVLENDGHSFKEYVAYKYNDIDVEEKNSALWSKGYELIANNNVVLSHLENEAETPLTHQQFCMLRGEALGLRAMLHFDLLRRHGSIYSQNPEAIAIPYQDNSKREILPMLPHSEVVKRIIADLNESIALLKESDPIITEGTKNTVTEDNGVSDYDMSFRQLRFNYYAAQGMLARVYLWIGDRANAYRIAKEEIIDKITTKKLTVFPWTTKGEVEMEKRPDLIFSSEIMFAIYNSSRANLFNSLFNSSVRLSQRLTFYGEFVNDSKVSAFYDHDNDFRKMYHWEFLEPTQAEIDAAQEAGTEVKSSYYCKKYQDFESGFNASLPSTNRFMVPMLRLSEIYMIAAESTDDREEAYGFLNAIRSHRQCPDLPSTGNFDEDLTFEFAREMLGEGQLFYFYKRRAERRPIDRLGTRTFEMSLNNYVWPIPEAEMSQRANSGNL